MENAVIFVLKPASATEMYVWSAATALSLPDELCVMTLVRTRTVESGLRQFAQEISR